MCCLEILAIWPWVIFRTGNNFYTLTSDTLTSWSDFEWHSMILEWDLLTRNERTVNGQINFHFWISLINFFKERRKHYVFDRSRLNFLKLFDTYFNILKSHKYWIKILRKIILIKIDNESRRMIKLRNWLFFKWKQKNAYSKKGWIFSNFNRTILREFLFLNFLCLKCYYEFFENKLFCTK